MVDLIKVIVVGMLALALTFVAVVLFDDSTTAVPPPESVGEQFARHVAARRYDRALRYVDSGSGITLITVRLAGAALHSRAGTVENVEGEPGRIEGNHATASAVLITQDAGRIRYTYRLVRRSGLWKVVEWEVF